jgi:hypothetical protein
MIVQMKETTLLHGEICTPEPAGQFSNLVQIIVGIRESKKSHALFKGEIIIKI